MPLNSMSCATRSNIANDPRVIVKRRMENPLRRTGELAELVTRCIPAREKSKHPATRTFQAIRIAINGELDELEAFLELTPRVLRVGGRLCAITFHSLEDRMVKRFLRGPVVHDGPRGLPVPPRSGPVLRAAGKPIRATAAETAANPRARSATLRVGERAA
jgi:16S rRNA (cytosine1402-N4)-methyltransferase